MTTRTINTKKIASYGAVLASVGISSHAQATIVDLVANLPGSLAYSTAGSQAFDLIGNGGSFRQFNDTLGKSFSNNTNVTSFGSLANGTADIRLVNYSNTLTSGAGFGNYIPLSSAATGTRFIGFLTAANQVGWLQIDLGGAAGPITYLAAAFNDTPGGTIHVGTYVASITPPPVNPPVSEPSSLALLGLGLLATGATGVRKLRNNAKLKSQTA